MPDMELYCQPESTIPGYIPITDSLNFDILLKEECNTGGWGTKKAAFQLFPKYYTWQALNPVKVYAVTQTNTIENEADQTKKIIFQIPMSLSAPYKGSLAKRLFELFDDAKEEDPKSVGIAIGSLRCFLNFMQSCPNLKCPAISLTPEYNIYASWKSSINKVFSIHFLPSFDVRFVVFAPNIIHANKVIRISGMVTKDVLIKVVEPYGVLNWACDEG